MYDQALEFYLPDARLEMGGKVLAGGSDGERSIHDLITVVIKEYGRPRVRIEEIHSVGSRVYVETSTQLDQTTGGITESREFHVFEISEGKIARQRIFTDTVAPPRLVEESD